MAISIKGITSNVEGKMDRLRKSERFMTRSTKAQRENFLNIIMHSRRDELNKLHSHHEKRRDTHLIGSVIGSGFSVAGITGMFVASIPLQMYAVTVAGAGFGAITVIKAMYHHDKKENHADRYNLIYEACTNREVLRNCKEYRAAVMNASLSPFVDKYLGTLPEKVNDMTINEYIDSKYEQRKRIEEALRNAYFVKKGLDPLEGTGKEALVDSAIVVDDKSVIDDNSMKDETPDPAQEENQIFNSQLI